MIQAGYGEGSDRIWLYGVQCTGTETGLHNCLANRVSNPCTHAHDAGVRCQPGMHMIVNDYV